MIEPLLLANLLAQQRFSASNRPTSASVPCPGWRLTVVVKLGDRAQHLIGRRFTVTLERYGRHTGRRQASKDVSKEFSLGHPTNTVHFNGKDKKRYRIRVTLNGDFWFWKASEGEVRMRNEENQTVEILLESDMVLVDIGSIADHQARIRDAEDSQHEYGLTRTVAAAEIQGVIGADKLTRGVINANAMIAKAEDLVKLLDFTSPPYFAVVDINLAHQMSFFLACLAFHQYGQHDKKLVINFDNHADYRTPDGSDVSFDGWGSGFFKNSEKLSGLWGDARVVYTILGQTTEMWANPYHGFLMQYYYSNKKLDGSPNPFSEALGTKQFGTVDERWIRAKDNGKGWVLEVDGFPHGQDRDAPYADEDLNELVRLGVLVERERKGRDTVPPRQRLFQPGGNLDVARDGLRQGTIDFIDSLDGRDLSYLQISTPNGGDFVDESLVGDLSTTDVYVTVDRDVSQGSYTFWNDGSVSAVETRTAVQRCLQYLKSRNANLVGFDVSGLPDTAGCSTALGLHAPQGIGCDPGAQEPAIIRQARDDIDFFYQQVLAYGPAG